jgi:acetyl-CoA acyltransferase
MLRRSRIGSPFPAPRAAAAPRAAPLEDTVPEAFLVDLVRTPSGRGKPGGALSGTHPVDLLAALLAGLVERSGLDPAVLEDVITGCVGQVGEQAVNIGRSAVLAAGFPESVPATTIDRQCGSSQQAAHFAAQGVLSGAYDVVVACGVESMSRIPMGTSTAGMDPFGPRFAARFPDGLVNQGVSAELIAARWKLDREMLDEYSARSHQRAAATAAAGGFANEILPVTVTGADGSSVVHTTDETVRAATTAEGLGGLRPSFRNDEMSARFPEIEWSITPGNSSPLTDGASAALIVSEAAVKRFGLTPRARFHAFSVVGDDPLLMLTGPIPATRKVLQKAGLGIDDMDAYEVNEAFAPVPLAWAHEVGADPEKLNPRGGAIALGHALGASGTRLLTTLVNHLEATGGRYGLQTMCEGGGLANATIIERL